MLVAFDIESVTGSPPCTNEYVAQMRDRHPGVIRQAWGAVDPLKGERAIEDAKKRLMITKFSAFTSIRSWAITPSMIVSSSRCGRPSTTSKFPS